MKSIRIHPSNLLYLIICLFGIAAFLLVGIFPNSAALNDIEKEIASLKKNVQSQEVLYPVYLKLLADITQKIPTKLTAPVQSKISHNDLNRINDTFATIASENNTAFVNAIPDAGSYLEDMGLLSMNVTFAGDFFDLRQLLLAICKLPYLSSIDRMQLETHDNQKRIIFNIKVAQE